MATANPLAVLSRLGTEGVREAIYAERASRSLELFWKLVWPVHHPATELIWNWHIPAICEHIEAVDSGEIGDLVINVPPGMAKSLGVSVYAPAWKWTRAPHWQFIAVGAVSEVVLRDARRMHEVCDSKIYQQTFLPQWDWSKSQDAKGYFANTAGGFRLSKTTGQLIIGIRGDWILIDDPLDASQAYADKARLEETNLWLDQSLSTRKNRPETPRILIMQRLHERDPSGHMLEQAGWTHLCLPNEHDGQKHKTWAGARLLHEDPRTEEGELLFPALCSAEDTERAKDVLGRIGYAGQYQQDPLPADGVIFLEEWFQYWEEDKLPKFDLLIGSWDLNDLKTKKATKDTDYVVGQLWGAHGLDRYLLAQFRDRIGQIESGNRIAQQYKRWPKIHKILIEDAANGPHVIADLESVLPRRLLEAIKVKGKAAKSKTQRAIACQRIVSNEEPGLVYLPSPAGRPWVNRDKGNFLAEVCGFPNRRRDDQVDAMTQALNWLRVRKSGFFSARAGS